MAPNVRIWMMLEYAELELETLADFTRVTCTTLSHALVHCHTLLCALKTTLWTLVGLMFTPYDIFAFDPFVSLFQFDQVGCARTDCSAKTLRSPSSSRRIHSSPMGFVQAERGH